MHARCCFASNHNPHDPVGSKLNLGLVTYGRSWKLLPATCTAAPGLPSPPGSQASGPGPASKCTGGSSRLAGCRASNSCLPVVAALPAFLAGKPP